MRIAFVLPGSGISGGVRTTQRFATALEERGHEVTIAYRMLPRNVRVRFREWHLRVRYPKTVDWLRRFTGVKRPYHDISPEVVGEQDFVLAVGPKAAKDVATLPPKCGIKVEHVRGHAQNESLVLEAWQRPWPKIVSSAHLKSEIEKRGFGPVVAVVWHGVDPEEYFPDGDELARKGVGAIWHQAPVKGPETALAVFRALRAARPNLPLTAFSYRPKPKNWPAWMRFVRRPSIERARRIYSSCNVWFCSSRSEGHGNPLLEAMACGCALVSTACGGPSDLIRDGETGFLVPVDDVDMMVGRITEILDDDSLRQRIVAGSRELAASRGWPAAAEKLEAALVAIRDGRLSVETAPASPPVE